MRHIKTHKVHSNTSQQAQANKQAHKQNEQSKKDSETQKQDHLIEYIRSIKGNGQG